MCMIEKQKMLKNCLNNSLLKKICFHISNAHLNMVPVICKRLIAGTCISVQTAFYKAVHCITCLQIARYLFCFSSVEVCCLVR